MGQTPDVSDLIEPKRVAGKHMNHQTGKIYPSRAAAEADRGPGESIAPLTRAAARQLGHAYGKPPTTSDIQRRNERIKKNLKRRQRPVAKSRKVVGDGPQKDTGVDPRT